MENICENAIRLGIDELCFTEHWEFDPEDMGYGHFDYGKYRENFERNKRNYRRQLSIKMGVEITFQKTKQAEIEKALSDYDFDFVLGSVHGADGVMYCSENSVAPFYEKSAYPDAYLPYFKELKCLAESGLFDSIGHFDLPKKYGTKHFGRFELAALYEIIEEILRATIETETAIEINTSGFRHPVGEQYPDAQILKLYRSLGGTLLTIGSDGHHIPEHGLRLDIGIKLAESVGFDAITVFHKRNKDFVSIR